jgi:ribose transport system permease protein
MINFSAGAMMLFAGIVGGNLAKTIGLGWPGLLIICILICLAEGALEGLLYIAMRVPCIVMSIGMMLVWESLPKIIYPNGVNLNGPITILCKQPWCFWVMGVTAVIFYIVYNKTPFGHNLRAIGSNQGIANSVGLDSDRIKFAVFTIGGLFLGIGAALYISSAGEQRNVSAMGSMTIMMDAFMGMFIAMFISRYIDTSIAVVLGTFAMKMLSNGFVAMGLSATVRDIIQGVFLLVLLVISANAGLIERTRANKAFKEKCIADYNAAQKTA